MPKIKLDPEQLAVARLLETCGWPHRRIGEVFRVDQSTVTYALRRRKTQLPANVADPRPAIVAKIMDRVDRVTRAAVCAELRQIAKELET